MFGGAGQRAARTGPGCSVDAISPDARRGASSTCAAVANRLRISQDSALTRDMRENDVSQTNLAWGALLLAGAFEVGFTTSMALENEGKRWASTLFYACIIASFLLLQYASKTIPLGIAYAVWTGLGAAGTLAVSTLVFRQPISAAQVGLVLVLIAVVAGLKLTSPH